MYVQRLIQLSTGVALVSCSAPSPHEEQHEFKPWKTEAGSHTIVLENVVGRSQQMGPDFTIDRYKLADSTLVAIYTGHNPSWDQESDDQKWKSTIGGTTATWRISGIEDSETHERKVHAETLFESPHGFFWHVWVIGDSAEAVKTAITRIDNASKTKNNEQDETRRQGERANAF